MTRSSQLKRTLAADVHEATRGLALAYGVEHLANETGTPAGTIYNKINPNESTPHKVTLGEAVLWSVLAQRAGTPAAERILHAFARTLRHVAIPMPDLSGVCDQDLVDLITRVGFEEGDFFRAINESLADKKFSRADFGRISKEGYEAMAAIAEALSRIEGLIDG